MPPKKDLCRNFQRGSCQYGDRCKFLHATQQQSKPNVFGFGQQSNTQFQHTRSHQQTPNPFGFGVQNSSQPRGVNNFGSNQNQPQFKPGENKWSRFSPINASGSTAPRQANNQPPASNHVCTDPELCKRQIVEDLDHERPLWKLTCYGHNKNGSCDIAGDICFEELRAAAYDDAKRGLSMQSIVERERKLLNSKLLEFESLRRNPYSALPNATLGTQSSYAVARPNAFPLTAAQNGGPPSVSSFSQLSAQNGIPPVSSFGQLSAQNSGPPSVSSFSQLNASMNMGFGMRPTAPNNAPGKPIPFEDSRQSPSASGANNFPFKTTGVFGSQGPTQSSGSPFAPNTTSFGNSRINAQGTPFSTSGIFPQIPNPASSRTSMLSNGLNFASSAGDNVNLMGNMPKKIAASGDDSIWLKEEWNPGEIPEEAPPDEVIF